MLGVKIDLRNTPTPDACAGFCGPAIEEISIKIASFRMPHQPGRGPRPAGELPAPVLQQRQIGRCSESRLKLQRQPQAQRAWPSSDNSHQAPPRGELADLCLVLKTRQCTPGFREEVQAFLFVTFSELTRAASGGDRPFRSWGADGAASPDLPRLGTYNGSNGPRMGEQIGRSAAG
jgi:hypothetical protein